MSSQPAVESDTETAVCCSRTEKAGSDVVKRENNVMGYDRLTSLSRLYWSQAGNTQTAPMISPPQTSRRTSGRSVLLPCRLEVQRVVVMLLLLLLLLHCGRCEGRV